MSTSYGLTIEFSRNEKLQKGIIFLSQDTNYLHKWLVMFTGAMFVFSFAKIPKFVQSKNGMTHLD